MSKCFFPLTGGSFTRHSGARVVHRRRLSARPPQAGSLSDKAAAQHLANGRRILSGLTPAEQRQLADLLRKLNITLPPHDTDQPPPARRVKPGPAAHDSQQNTP